MPPPSQDSDDVELSPLAYARSHGLARDYRAERSGFLELECLRDSERAAVESTQLPMSFDWGPEPRIEERLLMSQNAAILLRSVLRPEDLDQVETQLISLLDEKSHIHGLKLELPLLRSDHETDCRNFRNREDFDFKVRDIKLPLEVLMDAEDDPTWSPQIRDSGLALIEKLKTDKLCVTKDAVAVLQHYRKESWTMENAASMWESQQVYKKNFARDPVTPPLSPVYNQIQPFQPSPSDSVYQVPISSDPLSPTKQDLKDLETEIFRQDLPAIFNHVTLTSNLPDSIAFFRNDDVVTSDIYLPFAPIDNLECPVLAQSPRLKRESFKIDELLTPRRPALNYPESVRLEDVAKEFDLYSSCNRKSPIFESKLFENTFLPAHEEATQRAEQEILMEADITCRVDVPIMDFSKGPAPWEVYGNITNEPARLVSLQRQNIENKFGMDNFSWPGSTNLDHKLRWNPFPRDLSVNIVEDLHLNDSAWDFFLPSTTGIGIIDSFGSVWKPDGLRISREEGDEFEIEISPTQADGLPVLAPRIEKRKNEMEKLSLIEDNVAVHNKIPEKTGRVTSELVKKSKNSTRKRGGEFELLSGLSFSASNAVDNFLKLRGAKKKRLDDNTHLISQSVVSKSQSSHNKISQQPDTSIPNQSNLDFEHRKAVLGPSICKDHRINLIVSLKMMINRRLTKKIEDIFPCLNLVERDFSSHNKAAWLRGSVARSPIISPLESEADFIVSPTTGVIITNLQKIKQKPLPGQKSQSEICARLASISTRYEKLIVLVSEGGTEDRIAALDASDCLAFNEFYGFAMALDTTILVHYVSGGETTLAQWLAGIISNCHVEGPNLLREETHWELFLRRAGCNSFAAQAIISNLKTPLISDSDSLMQKNILGLAGFVRMNANQRMERFGQVVGRRVMHRVSALIDSRWNN